MPCLAGDHAMVCKDLDRALCTKVAPYVALVGEVVRLLRVRLAALVVVFPGADAREGRGELHRTISSVRLRLLTDSK